MKINEMTSSLLLEIKRAVLCENGQYIYKMNEESVDCRGVKKQT